jgi:hypothetical protein
MGQEGGSLTSGAPRTDGRSVAPRLQMHRSVYEGGSGMHERYLGRIHSGMDVCDSKGSRFGSVARMYRHDAGEVDATSVVGAVAVATDTDELLEVKTGPFGLGKHYFVPLRHIHEVIGDTVILSLNGYDDDMDHFRRKPDYIDRLH